MHRLGSHAVRPTAIRKAWKEYWPECRTDTSALVEREHLGGSRLSMCPTMPRRGTGPAGSRSRSAGRRRCTASHSVERRKLVVIAPRGAVTPCMPFAVTADLIPAVRRRRPAGQCRSARCRCGAADEAIRYLRVIDVTLFIALDSLPEPLPKPVPYVVVTRSSQALKGGRRREGLPRGLPAVVMGDLPAGADRCAHPLTSDYPGLPMVITECGAAFDDHPDEPDSCHTTTAPNTSQRTPPPSALPGRPARMCAGTSRGR